MRAHPTFHLALVFLPLWPSSGTAQAPLHHELAVRLEPATHRIEVLDSIALPADLLRAHPAGLRMRLHAGLEVAACQPPYRLEALSSEADPGRAGINDEGAGSHTLRVRDYLLSPPAGGWPAGEPVRLSYAGTIYHPLVAESQEYARSFSRSPGIIDSQGAVLSASSWWIPSFGEQLVSFRLTVQVPAGWDVVSQGARSEHRIEGESRHVTWECTHPMDEVHLIAGAFTEYSRAAGAATAQAFLRTPDPNLAAKYLEATAQYLEMYRKLIGPYPYAKFALVENFWETGYGMPSFTLLGPKVIRFPFILHSSYPHEILHNWWGNSVFVDYSSGNWCEGLTAYLADHLIKEGQGRGREYRRDALERYRSYVRAGHDFPLTEFRARHSSASEAVGYGKAMMLFHMLRLRLGDEKFTAGLQSFYKEHIYQRASFDDLARTFSQVAGEDLGWFFEQWTRRTGAPELELEMPSPRAQMSIGGVEHTGLTLVLRQVQEGAPYRLSVPVAFQLEGQDEAKLVTLELDEREKTYGLDLHGRPLLVAVDPGFDVFRRLDRREIPAALGQLFGAPRVTIVLPPGPESDPMVAGWLGLAAAWSRGQDAEVDVKRAEEIEELPADRTVWVLGRGNPWARAVAEGVERYGAKVAPEQIDFGETRVESAGHCIVLTCPHPANPELTIGWIDADLAPAIPGLARKLPHYGKYSYLAFSGAEPTNVAKGQWPALDSPLVRIPGESHASLALPAERALARLAAVFDPTRLLSHARYLSADELEGRGVGTAGLETAADWIAARFEEIGLEPAGDDGTFFQSWYEPGGPADRPVELRNVVGVIPGSEPGWAQQSVVIGAHYDHLGRGWPDVRQGMAGQIHNGADDNASGVAVMLEVARLLARELKPKRSIVFVAFSGEEWGLKGSRFYVRAMRRWPITAVHSMINLDTVGRLGGAKLQVLGTGSAREWPHVAMGIGFTTGVESTAIPDDPAGSDQRAFTEAGVPAVQLFTGANEDYHRPSDDVEKLDAEGMVAVATFLREAIVYLSEREEPLSATLAGAPAPRPAPASGTRRASLGTMPDFAFSGPGVRVAKVMDGSAAAAAGLLAGDVLLALDGAAIGDLRAYSEALKSHSPGDRIRVRLRRGEREIELEATLGAR